MDEGLQSSNPSRRQAVVVCIRMSPKASCARRWDLGSWRSGTHEWLTLLMGLLWYVVLRGEAWPEEVAHGGEAWVCVPLPTLISLCFLHPAVDCFLFVMSPWLGAISQVWTESSTNCGSR